MEFTISQNEINSLKKGVEGQGNLKFKTSDTPDDRLKFTITSEDLTSFKEMDTPEDKDLKSAMAMAFGLGISDTVRGVQQIAGRETNYLTGRNMREEQNELKDLMDKYGFAVTASYFGGAILDPASWLLPFAKAKTLLKMGYYGMVSGGIAGATGYVDADSILGTRTRQAGAGLIGGGIVAPAFGVLKNAGVVMTGKGTKIPLYDRPIQTNFTTKDAKKFNLQKISLQGKEKSRIIKGSKVIISSDKKRDMYVRKSDEIEKKLVRPKEVDDLNTTLKTILPRIYKNEDGRFVIGRKQIELGIDKKLIDKVDKDGKVNLRAEQKLEMEGLQLRQNGLLGGPKMFFNRFIAAPYREKIGNPLWQKINTAEGGTSTVGGALGFASAYNEPYFNQDAGENPLNSKLGRAFLGAVMGFAGIKFLRHTSPKDFQKLPFGKRTFRTKVGSEKIEVDQTMLEFLGRQIVDGFGIPKEVKFFKNISTGEANSLGQQFEVMIRNFKQLTPPEMAVVHNLIEGDITEAIVKNRALITVARDTKKIIQDISQRLVDTGFIKEDVMKRNFNTYLSRLYLDNDRIDVKTISDLLRPRGHVKQVTVDDYLKIFSKEKAYDDNGKLIMIRGGKDDPDFIPHRGWELPPQITIKELKKAMKTKDGIELLKKRDILDDNDNISIRWEMTKGERLAVGEIEDVSAAINQTMRQMTSALGNAKYYDELAKFFKADKRQKIYRGLSEKEMLEKHGLYKIPTTKVDKTDLFRYGNLAGKYVPKGVFIDVVERQRIIDRGLSGFLKKYRTLNQMWKASKTAWNPTVHVNNVVGNIFFTDMADVDFKNLPLAARMLAKHNNPDTEYQSKIVRLAKEHGVFDAGFVDKELRNIDKAGLGKIYKYDFEKDAWNNAATIGDKVYSFVLGNKFIGTLNNYYRIEDHIFRLNAFIDRLQKGYSADEAAMFARKNFIDYDIDAPLINALRQTATPFLAFTYRVVPLLAQTAVTRPWKYAKWGTIGYLINKSGEVYGGGDPEVERALINADPYKGGSFMNIPFFPYKNMKLPFTDKDGNSKYWFMERYFPGGDIFELGSGALPFLPAPLQPSFGLGGAVLQSTFGFDTFTMKKVPGMGFTTGGDVVASLKHLIKSLVPNFPFVPGSYATERINKASVDYRSAYKEGETELQAIMNSVGFKISNESVVVLSRKAEAELTKRLRVKKAELTKLGIDLREGLITKSQYDGDRQDILSDMEKIAKSYRLRMEGYDPVLIREPQIVLDILGQFGLIDKKYAQKKYGMKELEKTK
jgi:hypothetical protein